MPYTMEDFKRDALKEYLDSLTMKELLKNIAMKQRSENMPSDEILNILAKERVIVPYVDLQQEGSTPQELLKNMETFFEQRAEGISSEQVLNILFDKKILKKEALQAYLKKLADNPTNGDESTE